MKPYLGRIRITCSKEEHKGRRAENTKAACINCPGSLVEVLDLDGNVIATKKADEAAPEPISRHDEAEGGETIPADDMEA